MGLNFFFLTFYLLLLLVPLGLHCLHRLSLIAANGGYFLVAAHGLLISVASLVSEHRL